MNTTVTFIIPVRHQDNAKDWSQLKANLNQTINSINSQTNHNWRAIIVANHGADLPDLPPNFEVVNVTFPPNNMHDQVGLDKEAFYDSFRMDKGRRVLAGMLHVHDTNFYMIVDDDDFVSNKIVDFVSKNNKENGWKIENGYVWGDGGKLLYKHNDFANFCGTSLIIRSDLYQLPANFEEASPDYIKSMLGSHVRIAKILADKGNPLTSLPFRGAIYRIGHVGAHSKSSNLLKMYLFNKSVILKPFTFLRNIMNLQLVNDQIKVEFFGNNI